MGRVDAELCAARFGKPGLETIKKFEIGRRQAGEQGAFAELQGFELQTGYRRDGLRQHIEQTHEFVATASLQQSKLLTELRREIHDTSLVREDLLIRSEGRCVGKGSVKTYRSRG